MSKKKSFVTPLPKKHPLYTMVGRVASEWSHVEHRLNTIIWALSGTTNELADCVTSQLVGIPARCNAIMALGRHLGISEQTLKLVNKVKGDSYNVADGRNRVVHEPWFMEYTLEDDTQFPEGTAAQFKGMKGTHFGLKPTTEVEVDEIIQQIKKLGQTAVDARRAIWPELKALRRKSS